MKKCPFCAEEIQDLAVKCKHCGEFLDASLRGKKDERPWYFKDATIVTAHLCLMALALPLVWLNPYYSLRFKVVVSVIVIVITWGISAALGQVVKGIESYYQLGM